MGRARTVTEVVEGIAAPTEEAAAALGALGIEPPAVVYLGSGERIPGAGESFIGGVPARNLSREEWAALNEAIQRLCLDSGVYQLAGAAAPDEPSEG